jgi:hypothetical protein
VKAGALDKVRSIAVSLIPASTISHDDHGRTWKVDASADFPCYVSTVERRHTPCVWRHV